MARFDFKLEGLLTQRRNAENETQRVMAEAQFALTRAEAALRDLDTGVKEVNDDARKQLVGVLDLRYITAHRRYMVGMQRKAIELAEAIARARLAVDEARCKLSEAAKARKALEKLRETHEARWKADQAKRETADLDEAGMQIAYGNLTDQEQTE